MTFYQLFNRLLLLWLAVIGLGLSGCAQQTPNTISLVLTYGSEKEAWLKDVTEKFNQQKMELEDGRIIQVDAIPMGSGEVVKEILQLTRRPHLISPASEAFIVLGNKQAEENQGKPLVTETKHLVLSPVVIAMWKPMAEALGWGEKRLGWQDILQMAVNAEGWAAHDYPQWGKFKFGHTHPEYSNSGLISLLAQVYAATGKTRGLKVSDVKKPETARYLRDIQSAIVHYGRSTGFFGRKLFANGPGYLSAAILYENMVIESYNHQDLPFPVVALYPKEGTFWSDHPIGIVEREWVTEGHRQAAEKYLAYLFDKPQQEKALEYGFRPGDYTIPVTSPVDKAHGVDPKEPQTLLKVPDVKVIEAILDLWHENKKHANVALVLDTSGSMKGEKIKGAKDGALAMIEQLGEADRVSLLSFSHDLVWQVESGLMSNIRGDTQQKLNSLLAHGGTALYDAIKTAYDKMLANPHPDMISAIVVLTDGENMKSKISLEDLLDHITFESEKRAIRVFTIGYGDQVNKEVLNKIAETTQAKFYQGNTVNIGQVFRKISTFF